LLSFIVDPEHLSGVARLLEGFRDHDRDGLVIVLDLGPPSSFAVLSLPFSSLPAFSAVTMARTPGAAFAAATSIDLMRPFGMAEPTT
jgi:hypothetical protein